MRARLATGLLCILVGLALMAPAALGQGGTVSGSYMQTFDGMPSAPVAYRPPGWDVQIHSRDAGTWDAMEPMLADHGPACQGPPMQHDLSSDYPPHVFNCHDHVMTAIKADGYGVIYLTPPARLDWSQAEATLRWDMSTQRGSIRDWVDVWLTPYADHLTLPLEGDFVPDLAGAPPNFIHLQMGAFNGESTWALTSARDGVSAYYGPPWGFTWPSIEATVQSAGGPSPTRRDTFELKVRDGHVSFGMPGFSTIWIDSDTAPWGFDQAVVQFGHHSYFPAKACDGLLASQLRSPAARVSSGVPQSVAFAAEPHPPSLHRMGVDVPILGIDVPFGAMSDGGRTVTRDLSASSEVAPLAVDLMRYGFQVPRIHADWIAAEMVNVHPDHTLRPMSVDIHDPMGAYVSPMNDDAPVATTILRASPRPAREQPSAGVDARIERIPPVLSPSKVHHQSEPPAQSITCLANTWHWDNVLLSPSVPISITSLSPRQFTNTTGAGGWLFPAPALPETTLRFSADSAPQDVASVFLSWDAGVTWQTVVPAPSSMPHDATINHAKSYRVPVPVGATSVQVRGAGGTWFPDWRIKDAALWLPYAPGVPLPPTPAPAATATAQASITPLVPTVTPTDLPTAVPATPTPGPTQTAVPTRTPVPPASPTPTVGPLPGPNPSRPCQVPRARFGVTTWDDVPTSQCR